MDGDCVQTTGLCIARGGIIAKAMFVSLGVERLCGQREMLCEHLIASPQGAAVC